MTIDADGELHVEAPPQGEPRRLGPEGDVLGTLDDLLLEIRLEDQLLVINVRAQASAVVLRV